MPVVASVDLRRASDAGALQSGFSDITSAGGSVSTAELTSGSLGIALTLSADSGRDRGSLASNTTPIGYSNLYRDFVMNNGVSKKAVVTLSGLNNDTEYDIRVFGYDKDFNTRSMTVTDETVGGLGGSGNTGTGNPSGDNDRSVLIRMRSTSSGGIVFSSYEASQGLINGFIITTVGTPLPVLFANLEDDDE